MEERKRREGEEEGGRGDCLVADGAEKGDEGESGFEAEMEVFDSDGVPRLRGKKVRLFSGQTLPETMVEADEKRGRGRREEDEAALGGRMAVLLAFDVALMVFG
ncbi:hypothetical protein HAX54_015494 [Datura stramonium]|uniref:Uncharacterized protein n=1 Tax=Datura stramonium TaxID=4076 RepID=A0ABS8RZM0_DATST|nr:hypothetical protein [Datura stramonium]